MPAPFFEFSSDAFPAGERFDGWREEFARNVLGINAWRDASIPFWSRARLAALDGVMFGDYDISPCRTERSREFLSDGRHDLFCVLSTSGPLRCAQRGREIVLAPRQMTFMRADEVGVIESLPSQPLTSYRVIGMELDKMESRLQSLGDIFARPVAPTDPRAALFASYTDFVSGHIGGTGADELQLMLHHAVDLMALALGPRADSLEVIRNTSLRAARLTELRSALAKNAANPRLTAERLGAMCNISERYVQLLFESAGTTFSESLLAIRLENVKRQLLDPACGLPVSRIALSCGFSDISYFNRTFKRRFGLTPGDMRRSTGKV
jgi:AraC-like DNA-binding protein